MNVEQLKEKARSHELREEWQKAFDLYSTALRMHDEDEPPDITLYNRVGDIQTRLGQIDGAVEQYEKAVSLYLEAELPNNAIAICKKVLRNLPDRVTFFLRMGQIRASQGFLTDARQNFLTYAERQTRLGDTEAALSALVEFMELSPEDVEIRQSLASQLEAHGRTGEAVEQYVEAYRQLVLGGEDGEAEAISEKLEELSPGLELPEPHELIAEAAAPEIDTLVLESTSLGGLELEDWGEGAADLEGREVQLEDEPEKDSAESDIFGDEVGVAVSDLEFGEVESVGGEVEFVDPEPEPSEVREDEEGQDVLPSFEFEGEAEGAEVLSGFGAGTLEDGPEAGGDSLPLIGFEDEDVEDLEVGAPEVGAPEVEALAGALEEESISILDLSDEGGEGLTDDDSLPLLGCEDEDVEEEVEVEASSLHEGPLEAALEDVSFELAREDEEPAEVIDTGAEDDEVLAAEGPRPLLDPTSLDHEEAAARGEMGLALERVRNLIGADPDSVELHQRLVEYAFRANDQEVLTGAYLDLAGCLARTNAPAKARAVYQQVLALSPGHPVASEGIQSLDGTPATEPPAQVASSEEYVDLGSMILGDDAEKTTRWTVAAEAPSGDDEADFAKMLGQFKEKVSEHVAADDVTSHHDLGTAYMEMGLFDEAVGEFQMALRASPSHLPTHEVMGRCWMEMGKPDMAVRALTRALNVPYEVEDEIIGIYYLMGRAQEEQGNSTEALEFYEKVFSLDINFEDVTDRLRALR